MSPRSVETTPDNMAGIGTFLRNAWNKEPVIVVSCGIGLLVVARGSLTSLWACVTGALTIIFTATANNFQQPLTGAILPFISPLTKYTAMMNAAVPYTYPVPVRDDGNMPDIPAHPREPQGRNLDWLKEL